MYRFVLERYRGRATRYECPVCHRKGVFTRYVDTQNNNIYVSPDVGKCSRLDKCGFHYTPRQYYDDHPWLRDTPLASTPSQAPSAASTSCPPHLQKRLREALQPAESHTIGIIPWWLAEPSLSVECDYKAWLRRAVGCDAAERIISDYYIGGLDNPESEYNGVIFWQVDIEGRLRTGKVMAFDPTTGKRRREPGCVDWVHATLRREGAIADDWPLVQCLYGEHLLRRCPDAVVALAEGAKTAHIGSALFPDMVWLGTDSLTMLTAERLAVLKGRRVVLFPDQGRGFEEWSRKIGDIAQRVGFQYIVSSFVEANGKDGGDIGDLIVERD